MSKIGRHRFVLAAWVLAAGAIAATATWPGTLSAWGVSWRQGSQRAAVGEVGRRHPLRSASAVPVTGSGAAQTISLDVMPGRLSVTPTEEQVALKRSTDGCSTGTIGPVTVMDARGSLVGWTLRAQVSIEGDGRGGVKIRPGAVTTVAGNRWEVSSGAVQVLRPEHGLRRTGILMYAPPGGGGGTFATSAGLAVCGQADYTSATVTLAVG